jgi:hypothetical protein
MIRHRLDQILVHGLSSLTREGCTRWHDPVLGSLRAAIAGPGFDAAGIDSALPTMTSLLSAFCCRFLATSSRMALQVLSTRQGFFSLGKSHWLSLLASGAGGGGGFSTVTCALVAGDFNPRESVQVALTVIVPAEAPAVFSVAVLPLPLMLPPVALQSPTVTGTLSGLVQLQVMVELPPACREVGLAEQLMVGGFLGGSFTVKFAEQLAVPPFFIFGSLMLAVTV